MTTNADWRRAIARFYVLACGISWLIWSPLVLGRSGLRLLPIAPSLPVTVSLGTLGPFIACFVTHRIEFGNWHAVRILDRSWFRLSWLFLGPLLILFCFFVVFPALISKGSPATWRWHVGAIAGIAVPMFNYNLFGGPLFEEFGWRGFLQTRLQSVFAPWIAAMVVGVLWAVWHLPLFLLSNWTCSPFPLYVLIVVALSFLMAFGFNASGQSVVVAIVMHSAFNSSPRFLTEFLAGVPTREHPSGEALIALSFLSVGAIITLLTRGHLAAAPKAPAFKNA